MGKRRKTWMRWRTSLGDSGSGPAVSSRTPGCAVTAGEALRRGAASAVNSACGPGMSTARPPQARMALAAPRKLIILWPYEAGIRSGSAGAQGIAECFSPTPTWSSLSPGGSSCTALPRYRARSRRRRRQWLPSLPERAGPYRDRARRPRRRGYL